MTRRLRNVVTWLRGCRASILTLCLLPLSLIAHASQLTTQELANSAREGEGLIRALEQEYVNKRQAILDDPSLSSSDRQRKISTMDGELKRNRVNLWAAHIHPFQERVMEEVNQNLPEAEKIRPTGGSELYARDDVGNFITEKHLDGTESKVFNRRFKGADLDVGTESPEAAAKFYQAMIDNGFDPENSNRYSADFMDGKFTLNVGPDDHPSGSYKHRASVLDMGNSYETFVSISCQRFEGDCPGGKLVTVNDVNSKGIKYLHDTPEKLLGFENQDRLGNAAKSALKALEVGEVTPEQLDEIAKGRGFAPNEFRKILKDVKEEGKSFAGVGLNKDNIADFQEMARGVTDQAVDNAKVSWEADQRKLQQKRQTLEEAFNRAKEEGLPESRLDEIRKGMRDIDIALTDARVRVNATTKVNQRLASNASASPGTTGKALRKVYDTVSNAGGAVGAFVQAAGFDQATRTTGASLADSAKGAFRPGWLSSAGYGLDAYNLYNCSKDPASAARQVCYWKEGSGVVFNVMSDIGVAGSAGVGLGGALGTGTAAGLVTIGAPIIVTGVAAQKVTDLVGEVKGAQAARLNEKFINYRAEERTLEVILRRETLARELLEKFKSTGNWEYLKQAQTHIARLRRAGKVSSDVRYSQSAELVQARATEYASLVSAKPPKQDVYDFESNQLGAKNATDVANLKERVAAQKAAQERNVDADTAADSLSFDDAATAVADHKAALAQIEQNRRETTEIYAQIEARKQRREEEWDNFWQGLSVVASGVAQATAEYAQQTRQINAQLAQAEVIEEPGSADQVEQFNETDENDSRRNFTFYDPCAYWINSPSDYQNCKNDPCSVHVYDRYAFQSCRANYYAPPAPQGDAVPTVKPENMKEGVCNKLYRHGANEPEQYSIPVPPSGGGQYVYWYEHFQVTDRARIYLNGSLIHDTGCRGDSETVALQALSGGGQVKLIIDPRCDPTETSGTSWKFELRCP